MSIGNCLHVNMRICKFFLKKINTTLITDMQAREFNGKNQLKNGF